MVPISFNFVTNSSRVSYLTFSQHTVIFYRFWAKISCVHQTLFLAWSWIKSSTPEGNHAIAGTHLLTINRWQSVPYNPIRKLSSSRPCRARSEFLMTAGLSQFRLIFDLIALERAIWSGDDYYVPIRFALYHVPRSRDLMVQKRDLICAVTKRRNDCSFPVIRLEM